MKINKTQVIFLLLAAVGLILVGCESDDNGDTTTDPLVGEWVMSNMEQSSTYVAADSITALGYGPGTPLGSGSMVWAQFSALGVSATVNLKEDNTFTLTGSLPVANDTLGFAPSVVPLNDQGTWSAAADYSTLLIDGGLYDLGGALTMDDPTNPTDISMAYTEVDTITVVLPVDVDQDGVPDMFLPDVSVQETSTTTLGWTAQ
ncbi:MAG: hypothetical protein ACE5D8_07385 [Fidelibacterota bacterium]